MLGGREDEKESMEDTKHFGGGLSSRAYAVKGRMKMEE